MFWFFKKKVRIPIGCMEDSEFGVGWRYLSGWDKSNNYFIEMQKATLNGKDYFSMSYSDYEEALEYVEESKQKECIFNKVIELNNKGISLEKSGLVDEAIDVYEENIKHSYPARHSYDRLLVLYRKKNDKGNELRVLRKAIAVFPEEDRYLKRLNKIEQ